MRGIGLFAGLLALLVSTAAPTCALTPQQQYSEQTTSGTTTCAVTTTDMPLLSSTRVAGWTQICGAPKFLNMLYPYNQYSGCVLFACGVAYLQYVQGGPGTPSPYDCKDAIGQGLSNSATCCAAAEDFWNQCLAMHALGSCPGE